MELSDLIEGNPYETVQDVMVCNYSDSVCSLQNQIELQEKTRLIYQGRSQYDDGFLFRDELTGNVYCLHDDDLLYINFAA